MTSHKAHCAFVHFIKQIMPPEIKTLTETKNDGFIVFYLKINGSVVPNNVDYFRLQVYHLTRLGGGREGGGGSFTAGKVHDQWSVYL